MCHDLMHNERARTNTKKWASMLEGIRFCGFSLPFGRGTFLNIVWRIVRLAPEHCLKVSGTNSSLSFQICLELGYQFMGNTVGDGSSSLSRPGSKALDKLPWDERQKSQLVAFTAPILVVNVTLCMVRLEHMSEGKIISPTPFTKKLD